MEVVLAVIQMTVMFILMSLFKCGITSTVTTHSHGLYGRHATKSKGNHKQTMCYISKTIVLSLI